MAEVSLRQQLREAMETALRERPPCTCARPGLRRTEWACAECDVDAIWPVVEAAVSAARAETAETEEAMRRVVANESNHYDRYWQPLEGPLTDEWLNATEAKMREALEDVFCDDAAAIMLQLIAEIRRLDAARQEGRNDAARDIEAHRAKHAPMDGNLAQRRMSRHLGIAARVAQGPIDVGDVAAALARSVPGTTEGQSDG